jgi:hypothetical protein
MAKRLVPVWLALATRYPLVIGALRPLSTAITNEFLASHGYVLLISWNVAESSGLRPGAKLFRDRPRQRRGEGPSDEDRDDGVNVPAGP